jgi:monoamine oxidase
MIQTLVARVQGMIQMIQTLVARVQGMIQMIQTLVARVQDMIQMEEKVLDLVKITQILWVEEDLKICMEEVVIMMTMKILDEKIPRTDMVLI